MGGDIVKVAAEVATFLANVNGANLLQKTQNASSAFAEKFPKLTNAARMFFYIGFCMGVTMVVQAFRNWDNLTDEDKARAVTATVGLAFQAMEIVPEMLIAAKDTVSSWYTKLYDWIHQDDFRNLVDDIGSAIDGEDWLTNGLGEFDHLLSGTGGSWKTAGTLWEKLSGVGEAVSKMVAVIGVVVAAVFAVLSTIDF